MTARNGMRTGVFILSDVRSDSTLLDQCLGAHREIVSLGEVHWLRAYVKLDRAEYDPVHELICACGKRVSACEFWTAVQAALGRPLESLSLRSGFSRKPRTGTFTSAILHLPRRLLRSKPGLYQFAVVRRALGGRALGRDTIDLLDAASEVAGRPVCIDSSKSPFRFRTAYCLDPTRIRAIVLARDFRAVVHSKMKRGATLERAALGWRIALQDIDELTRDLPSGHIHRLRYEDLCANPRTELLRISRFLGLEFSEVMLRRPTESTLHHIGGSPSKFEVSRSNIELDKSFLDAFTDDDIRKMKRIVGAEAAKWSY